MACENPPCAEVGPFRYCPIEGCGWMEEPPPDPWAVLRIRLQERLTMAREVLDQEGYEDVAAGDPDHDWRLFVNGPLSDYTYQRQGEGEWVLVKQGQGFA